MLLVGSDDGVYRVADVFGSGDTRRVLESGQVMRVRTFDGLDGVFAATTTGLYHSDDGAAWRDLGVPAEQVYAVGAPPGGDRLYAGTRPADVYVARTGSSKRDPTWRNLDGVRALAARDDWGIERHGNVAQVRDLRVPEAAPDRVVAGVEVGGVYWRPGDGDTWTDRSVDGFDAPHTDDVHHVNLEAADTAPVATGSGLYRTTDAGRTWTRLDSGHRQRYFRESFAHRGVLFAGGSPTPPNSWEDDPDHALFECRDGRTLEAVSSPTPDEVPVGWCVGGDGVLAVTHRGTLLHRGSDAWRAVGEVPASESVNGRCVPLAWYAP